MLAISLTGVFKTILLLGSIQGFIVCSLLFFSKKNRQSNRLLGSLILLIALCCFNLYGSYENWFDSPILNLITQFVPLVLVMPFGPLVWFYMQSVLDPSFKLTKKQCRHFYPVLIDLVPSLTVIIYLTGVILKLIKAHPAPWGNFIDNYNVYADIPRWISVTTYVWLSAKFLTAYKRKRNGNLNGQAENYKWLHRFIRVFIIFQVIWFLYLVPYVIPKYTDKLLGTLDWYPIYIPLAILIYWLGINGYILSQRQVVTEKKSNGNSPLSPQLVKEVIASLTRAMEWDKIYLNPNLNLATMAETTGISQKTISAVLNQHVQISFNEFVNGYRINAFKEKILLPEMNHLTIAGIALECGFNSQATFQRTFKELTGQSPSEFRKMAAETN